MGWLTSNGNWLESYVSLWGTKWSFGESTAFSPHRTCGLTVRDLLVLPWLSNIPQIVILLISTSGLETLRMRERCLHVHWHNHRMISVRTNRFQATYILANFEISSHAPTAESFRFLKLHGHRFLSVSRLDLCGVKFNPGTWKLNCPWDNDRTNKNFTRGNICQESCFNSLMLSNTLNVLARLKSRVSWFTVCLTLETRSQATDILSNTAKVTPRIWQQLTFHVFNSSFTRESNCTKPTHRSIIPQSAPNPPSVVWRKTDILKVLRADTRWHNLQFCVPTSDLTARNR